jgi:hypothetical protein
MTSYHNFARDIGRASHTVRAYSAPWAVTASRVLSISAIPSVLKNCDHAGCAGVVSVRVSFNRRAIRETVRRCGVVSPVVFPRRDHLLQCLPEVDLGCEPDSSRGSYGDSVRIDLTPIGRCDGFALLFLRPRSCFRRPGTAVPSDASIGRGMEARGLCRKM